MINNHIRISVFIFYSKVSIYIIAIIFFNKISFRCSDLLHLAVLHPRKLSVYSVTGNRHLHIATDHIIFALPCLVSISIFCFLCCSGTSGNVEHGDQYQLKLMYEHNLQRTACNMTYGTFGGVTGSHMICFVSFWVVVACWRNVGTTFCCMCIQILTQTFFW